MNQDPKDGETGRTTMYRYMVPKVGRSADEYISHWWYIVNKGEINMYIYICSVYIYIHMCVYDYKIPAVRITNQIQTWNISYVYN
jgi:hypothetical protein